MEKQAEIPSAVSFRFRKEERLKSKKIIDKLFADGQSALAYPLKIVFLSTPLPAGYPVQAGFTVSKKNFKRAVQRNRIKRLMREAYRLNKHELYKQLPEQQLAVFFIFIGKELPEYPAIEKGIKKAFRLIVANTTES